MQGRRQHDRGSKAFAPHGLVLALGLLALGLPGPRVASAVDFDIEFRTTSYQVQATDTFADLEARHDEGAFLGSVSLIALEDVGAPIYAGVNGDYSILMSTVLDVSVAGDYVFQVGTDWGWGGGSVVIDNGDGSILDEHVTTDDLWWNLDWNDPDVFTVAVTLAAGSSYTIKWVGFEGCCGGDTTVRFSHDGGAFQTLDETNLSTLISNVPEPSTALLVGLGMGWLAASRRMRAA
jgi:hypothetical protein